MRSATIAFRWNATTLRLKRSEGPKQFGQSSKKPGAAGSLHSADAEEMDRIRMQAEALPNPWSEEGSDFDDACFCARYPRWTQLIPGLWGAYEKWKDDPRFLQEAPRIQAR